MRKNTICTGAAFVIVICLGVADVKHDCIRDAYIKDVYAIKDSYVRDASVINCLGIHLQSCQILELKQYSPLLEAEVEAN